MRAGRSRVWAGLLEEKLALEAGSLEHGLAVEARGLAETEAGARGSLLLFAASELEKHDAEAARRARREGARALLSVPERREEAVAALRREADRASQGYERAAARASLGMALAAAGKAEEGVAVLQEAVHEMNEVLGRAHPVAHNVQRLWIMAGLQEDLEVLRKHV